MTSGLTYEIRGNVGDIADFRLGDGTLTITVRECDTGYLAIGGLSIPITGGEARLDCSLLSDGEYRPLLISGGRQVRLERFAIEDGRLALLPTEESVIRELLSRARLVEARLLSAEEILRELKEKIACDTIF